MNGLHEDLLTGTLGELFVQLRLLQYGVQAAPPLKDTGNDLIAVRGGTLLAIQVKTTEGDSYSLPGDGTRFHVLAAVRLAGEGRDVLLEHSEIYLILISELDGLSHQFSQIEGNKISQELIDQLVPLDA